MKIDKLFFLAILVLLINSCLQEHTVEPITSDFNLQEKQELDAYILRSIQNSGLPFDWNKTSTDRIFIGVKATENLLTFGYSGNNETVLQDVYRNELKFNPNLSYEDEFMVYRDEVLKFTTVRITSKSSIDLLRNSAYVDFVEVVGYPFNVELLELPSASVDQTVNRDDIYTRKGELILDPMVEIPTYANQVANYNGSAFRTLTAHNVEKVYENYKVFGEDIGVAVLDNGILDEYKDVMYKVGYGNRSHFGYHNKTWFLPWSKPDGIRPQQDDILGLSRYIDGQWTHGSEQTKQVFSLAPNANIATVRCSPLVFLIRPSQIFGVIAAIKASAENPEIDIISMSMGAIFYINAMKRAVDYFYDQDKLFFAAAGTSFDPFKTRLGVIFPASLGNTVACTGLKGLAETNGVYIAGDDSHVGPEIDFTIQHNQSSSEATSKLAGMAALVWSANKSLNNSEVMEILINSSHFFKTQGQKDNKFGYGSIDIGEAVEMAMESN